MILTYPYYMGQMQIIGQPGTVQSSHGKHVPVSLKSPLCISLSTSIEYQITIQKGLCTA